MLACPLPNWTIQQRRVPDVGGRGRGHFRGRAGKLHICFDRRDERWADWAVQFWTGQLEGLEVFQHKASTIVSRWRLPNSGRLCYFKHFELRDRFDLLKHLVRTSRARRALVRGEQAQRLGFDVPTPLCLIEHRRFGLITGSALVTAEVANAPTMLDWLIKPELGVCDDPALRRRYVRGCARVVARWHEAGLYHGDLRLNNMLCRFDGRRDPHVTWLDNEGNRHFANLPRRLRVHNLFQLNKVTPKFTTASRSERLRFFYAYCEACGYDAKQRRALLERVLQRAQRYVPRRQRT